MVSRIVIALILCCSLFPLNAQDQYIVKLNGDTIRGKLQINPMRDNSQSMFFKYLDGSKENVRPIRISYVYYDEEHQYRSIPFYNQRLFMQILKEGRNLSYYHYIRKRDNSVATTKVLAKPNGDALEISALTFKKHVSEFLEDCPQIQAKVDAKEYRYKDLDQLVDDYNNCDIQVVLASSVNSSSKSTGSMESATVTAAAAGADSNNTGSMGSGKQAKLEQIDAFRKYVRGLNNFEHARDVLEWLTDVEYRVSQDRDVPNYLWNSLDAMTNGNDQLQEEAGKLQAALKN